MTRLQLLRAQALLVDLATLERRERGAGQVDAAAAVAIDREHLFQVLVGTRRDARSVANAVPDGVDDPRLEALLTRLELENS